MKVVTIMGGPRKQGNTAAVLAAFERLAGQEHAIDRIDITDYRVEGCRGCNACRRRPDDPGCAQKDDAVQLLERICAGDLVVYASPVYCWGFPAQLKALMDRHYCLVKPRKGQPPIALMAGKRIALLVTCGGDAEGNADLVQAMFQREADYLRAHVVGKYIVPNCTTPAQLGDRAEAMATRMMELITEPA